MYDVQNFIHRINRRKTTSFILSTLFSVRPQVSIPLPLLFSESQPAQSRRHSHKLSQLNSPLLVAVTVASSGLAEGRYDFKPCSGVPLRQIAVASKNS